MTSKKNQIQKWANSFWLIPVLLILLNLLTTQWDFRIDFTDEKRFTLSPSTVQLLESLDEPVDVVVYLSGDIKAEFRKLANSTDDLLTNFNSYANGRVRFRFENPGAGLSDSAKFALYDSLTMMGIRPTTQKAQVKAGESEGQRQLFPGAIVTYKGVQLGVDLLQGQTQKTVFKSDELLDRQTLNSAEALLEFKFASTIQKLVSMTSEQKPSVGYLIGHGEIPFFSPDIYDLSEILITGYQIDTVNLLNEAMISADSFQCLVMMRPVMPLSELDKLKLDQYVMQGGHLLILADVLYADRDSLSHGKMMAYSRDSEDLNELLFRWGAHIKPELIADQQCEEIPVEVGSIGGKGQYQLLGWPFFPLLQSGSDHPLVKNQSLVLGSFANPIDLKEVEGVRKTVLLSSSPFSSRKPTPAIIDINDMQEIADIRSYNEKAIPVALLSEGTFKSLYANNLSAMQDSMIKQSGMSFLPASKKEGKIILISDADIAINQVSDRIGPLPMGTNKLTKVSYANHDFIANCIEYLANKNHLLEARGKDYPLRLIDPKRAENEKSQWQIINLAVPILAMILTALFLEGIRRKKYARIQNQSTQTVA